MDLTALEGTGAGGRITKQDIEAAIAGTESAAPVSAAIATAATARPTPPPPPPAPAVHGTLAISKQFFGKTIEPYTGVLTPTYRYTLTNRQGMKIQILSYGAITQSIWVPGRHGHLANVVLGFKTLNDYVTQVSPPVIANGGPSRRARAAVADRATTPPAGGLAGPWSLTCGGLVTALRNTVIDTADGTTRRWL